MGAKRDGLDDKILKIIEDCINEIKDIINPNHVLEKSKVKITKDSVLLNDLDIVLEGESIKDHLKNSLSCVIMATTLGAAIDRKILYYEKIDMTKAIVLNACATVAIEEYCDSIEEEIKVDANNNGKETVWRYSPGYGDLKLDVQLDILNSLDAQRKIGLTVSDHNILIPRKSVTAIVGIVEKEHKLKKRGCNECSNFKNCQFRRSGEKCGY